MSESKDDEYGPHVRETYQEMEVCGTTYASVSDPMNDAAWIQSDIVVPIRE